jgi:hypothetical protein
MEVEGDRKKKIETTTTSFLSPELLIKSKLYNYNINLVNLWKIIQIHPITSRHKNDLVSIGEQGRDSYRDVYDLHFVFCNSRYKSNSYDNELVVREYYKHDAKFSDEMARVQNT